MKKKQSDVQTILIGRSGVGKTTNLLTFYGSINNKDNGYIDHGIIFHDSELKKGYDELILSNIMTKPTVQIKDRNLTLYRKRLLFKHRLITLNVKDINGGSVDAYNENEFDAVLDAMNDSYHVVIYMSCQDLVPDSSDIGESVSQLNHMLKLINYRMREGPVHLIFVFTYLDKITEDDQQEIRYLFKDAFDPNLEGVVVDHFFISNKTSRQLDCELPILAVIANELSNRISNTKENRLSYLMEEKNVGLASWLLDILYQRTGDGRWKIMKGNL